MFANENHISNFDVPFMVFESLHGSSRFATFQPAGGHPQPPSDADLGIGGRAGPAHRPGTPGRGRSLAPRLGAGRPLWHWGAGHGEAGLEVS